MKVKEARRQKGEHGGALGAGGEGQADSGCGRMARLLDNERMLVEAGKLEHVRKSKIGILCNCQYNHYDRRFCDRRSH